MTARPKMVNPVIDAVRRQLARSESAEAPLPASLARTDQSTDLVQQFVSQVTSAGAHCQVARTLGDARDHIAAQFATNAVRAVARSDGELINTVLSESTRDVAGRATIEDREQLFAADVGISEAQWGIAETGTLVLASGSERHRLTSLIPPIHMALLPASRIVATMSDMLRTLAVSRERHQAITFITGPSRTADIELTLVVGVHGPKELQVIVLLGS